MARGTVERLMRAMGMHGIRNATSPRTTRSAPKEQCAADLVNRHFSAFRSNEVWECGTVSGETRAIKSASMSPGQQAYTTTRTQRPPPLTVLSLWSGITTLELGVR